MNLRGAIGTLAVLACMVSPLSASQLEYKGYSFNVQVLKSSGRQYREFSENNQTLLKVRPNEEYSIVVYNPLPVRAAVAVSIDGLNTIDGKRTTLRNARKWMIGPKSSITIAGWQTSKSTLRKFLFTEQSASFAQWREDRDGKSFTRNLGVIGVAWFWNQDELEYALHPPQPFVDDEARSPERRMRASADGAPSAAPAASAKAEARAGTGMGRQQINRVSEVEFNATAGMFSVRDVMKIFYEFAKDPAEPQPFVDDDEDEGRFTPDMRR